MTDIERALLDAVNHLPGNRYLIAMCVLKVVERGKERDINDLKRIARDYNAGKLSVDMMEKKLLSVYQRLTAN